MCMLLFFACYWSLFINFFFLFFCLISQFLLLVCLYLVSRRRRHRRCWLVEIQLRFIIEASIHNQQNKQKYLSLSFFVLKGQLQVLVVTSNIYYLAATTTYTNNTSKKHIFFTTETNLYNYIHTTDMAKHFRCQIQIAIFAVLLSLKLHKHFFAIGLNMQAGFLPSKGNTFRNVFNSSKFLCTTCSNSRAKKDHLEFAKPNEIAFAELF